MDKVVVLFTMKQCPFCHMLKEMLDKEGVGYVDRDIHEYEEEYNLFVEVTENEFVPAFMLIESPEDNPTTRLFAPDRDFNDIEEGAKIIKEFFKDGLEDNNVL
jgi:glutaredoxin